MGSSVTGGLRRGLMALLRALERRGRRRRRPRWPTPSRPAISSAQHLAEAAGRRERAPGRRDDRPALGRVLGRPGDGGSAAPRRRQGRRREPLRVTPLFVAATNGNAPIIETLLKAGADANTATGDHRGLSAGEPALMAAARTGNVEAVKLLIDHGADVRAGEGWHKQSALMYAAAANSRRRRPGVARCGRRHRGDVGRRLHAAALRRARRRDRGRRRCSWPLAPI